MTDQGLSKEKELALLEHFASITSITNLKQLLCIVTEQTPKLLDAAGCSIYLLREFVSQYDGNLIDTDGNTIPFSEIKEEFIVLAANSRPGAENLIGKGFYRSGYGVTGWVFKHGRMLCLDDISDQQELGGIAPDLYWSDNYKGILEYYQADEKKPFLAIPLITDSKTIGVMKFPATIDHAPFSHVALQIATIVAQIIAGAIRQTWIVQEQARRIRKVIEIGSTQAPKEVYKSVTDHLLFILNCQRSFLYICDSAGDHLCLAAKNGQLVIGAEVISYERGQGVFGWIFKTGRYLILPDIRKYVQGYHLSEADILEISDGQEINDEDRTLTADPALLDFSGSMLAVPILSNDKLVLGVLAAKRIPFQAGGQREEFSRADLQVARSFASTIALALENERKRNLEALLIAMGASGEPKELYRFVVDCMPGLIAGSACWIYKLENGSQGRRLEISHTSYGELVENGGPVYRLGEGKTGFCALAEATLVIDHYGDGKVTSQTIESKKCRIENEHPHDFVDYLLDEDGNRVGLIQLRNLSKPGMREGFKVFANGLRISRQNGLPSPYLDMYQKAGVKPAWSYLVVPIKHDKAGLLGVITVGRTFGRNPFSTSDVVFVESLAGRLATTIFNLKMQENRDELLVTLAHEINTPLTGILADSENLLNETPDTSTLYEISQHNLEQVSRLQMLTETIMGVMSDDVPKRELSIHSIYRPLIEACKIFASEAHMKGCDIIGPKAKDSHFPAIEMYLSDLRIAFANIIHNAVKYSYKPSKNLGTDRYVRVTGYWADEQERNDYCVDIQNYGVGITQDEIENSLIFKPFYRGKKATDRRRTGAGFGLSYAQKVIQDLHYGKIRVTSKPVKGGAYLTTFTVILPVRQPVANKPD